MSTKSANVRVYNNTNSELISCAVAHKYSNKFKSNQTFSNVKSGAHTDSSMSVKYNTGFGTTGQDWWIVSWVNSDGKAYCTDPQNFRGIIDSVEKHASDGLGKLASTAAGALGQPEIAPIAKKITESFIKAVTNDESTDGFKSFILRSEDENQTVTITINENSVDYHVKSGEDTNNPISELTGKITESA